jgi:hypothetical protein
MAQKTPPPELKQWYAARRTIAALVLADPVYLPIFERVEREIAALEYQGDIISRARAITARYKAVA